MNDFSSQTRPGAPTSTTTTTDPAVADGPDTNPPAELHDLHANPHGDGVYAALAEAADRSRVVVLALVDGTRLNGVPLGFSPPRRSASTSHSGCPGRDRSPHCHCTDCAVQCAGQCAGGGTAVLIREESGQPPFVVRLAHVIYVRALTARRD